MRPLILCPGVLAFAVLSACGGETASESQPSSDRCVEGAGAGGQAGGASGAVPGGAASSITRSWSESVIQRGSGTSSVITQQYAATVIVSLTKVDVGAWTIAGTATIMSAFTSDWVSQQTSSSDGFYQFYVNIPGVDGSNATVRDDSGCNGPNNQETTPWSAAQMMASGSGDMTGSRAISGSSSVPREGGDDTVTWSFSLPE